MRGRKNVPLDLPPVPQGTPLTFDTMANTYLEDYVLQRYRTPTTARARVEAGNVYLPNPRPHGTRIPDRDWVEDFLHQLTVFPHGAHDDDVDAFTQLLVRWQRPEMSLGYTW